MSRRTSSWCSPAWRRSGRQAVANRPAPIRHWLSRPRSRAGRSELAVLQRRQLHAHLLDARTRELGDRESLALGAVERERQHLAPRIDDDAVAEGAAAVLVQP